MPVSQIKEFFLFTYSMSSHLMVAEAVCVYLGIQRATCLSLKVGLEAWASMHMPLVRIPQWPTVC